MANMIISLILSSIYPSRRSMEKYWVLYVYKNYPNYNYMPFFTHKKLNELLLRNYASSLSLNFSSSDIHTTNPSTDQWNFRQTSVR